MELEQFEKTCSVGLAAGQPVESLGHYYVEQTAACIVDELLNARSRGRREPGDAFVGIFLYDGPAELISPAP
ncbi:MAG TPA: hypothetical protein VGL66_09690 [Caulobacteraceae bacterium]